MTGLEQGGHGVGAEQGSEAFLCLVDMPRSPPRSVIKRIE